MPTKLKTLLLKISKAHRLGNNYNNVMLIIQKPVLWEQQHYQLEFVTILRYVIRNCLSFAANKQDTEFLTV